MRPSPARAGRFSLLAFLAALLPLPAAAPDAAAQQADSLRNRIHDPALYEGLEYRMIGPYRGGRATTVEGVEGKPFTYYMGSTGGGVWKTTDAGETWKNVTDGELAAGAMGAVEVADSDPSVIYAGTGSACIRGNVSMGQGVYKSEDGGDTWRFVGLREAGQVGRIAVHPNDPDVAYVAALGHPFGPNEQRGVFKTTDGGDTWEKVLFVSDSTGAVDLAMNPERPQELYAGMWRAERKPWTLVDGAQEGGLYHTEDGGETWEPVEGVPQGLTGKIGVTISAADPDRAWALITAPGDSGGVYRTDDGGDSWSRVSGARKLRQRGFYYTHIYADPQDPETVYVLNTDFYKSTDGGRTYDEIDVVHGDVHDLWLNPKRPEVLILANDGGAQVSVNGGESWTTMFNQPTAEFYRIEVDDRFRYRVYGSQQDNSTISVPAWRERGIHPKQGWYGVGGGESAHIEVDPRNPDVTYATTFCCGGWLDRVNQETRDVRDVVAYPQVQVGAAARDLEYRFQWNSPIALDPQNPDVLYHGAQYVLRTDTEGQSWERISPDLTYDDASKQGPAGGPLQHDQTGVEVYNTVFALTPSPHEDATIWAGTDDGRVWITRNGGEEWGEITPDGLPKWSTVNTIEVSPHRAGKAYIAVYRYRLDDFAPYIYRTTDHGESWTRVADGTRGIPADHPTRVVREDPDREGLLYAGTEYGLYVSFDDGAHWQSLQQATEGSTEGHLPTTPVTDLRVHRKDLVVGTQGRSFWILDNLTPLHQIDDEVSASEAYLFAPRAAYRVDEARFRGGRWPEVGPRGAMIDYWLAERPGGELRIEIVEEDGDLVRRFTSDTAAVAEAREDRGVGRLVTEPLPVSRGTHRVGWDLRYPGPDLTEDAVLWADIGGVKAVPGSYRVRMIVGQDTVGTRTLELRKDPRDEQVTRKGLEAQFELATAIRDTLDRLYGSLRTLRSVREQVRAVADRAERAVSGEQQRTELRTRADSIAAELSAVEDTLIQTKHESGQDVINFPARLDDRLAAVYEHVIEPDHRPNEGGPEAFEDRLATWNEARERLEAVLDQQVPAFNRLAEEAGVPAVVTSDER